MSGGFPGEDAAVALAEMSKSYGSVRAVEGLSLEVRRGETFGLIGPDGAGKTTAIRVVLGLLAPDAGRATTLGLDPVADHRELTKRIGYLSQRFSLYGDLSVDENIRFFAEVHDVRGWRPRRDELLSLLRLAPFRDRLAERLSGGMKQKLALACTLVHTPELLVMDEPTTGVDPVSRRDFWRILVRLQREGLTILLSTPYLDEAERCQRVALLDRGRTLALDAPDALRRGAAGSVVEVLASPRREAREALSARGDVSEVEAFGERLHATLPAVPPAEAPGAAGRLAEALRKVGIEVHSARAIAPTLEDVFIARVRAEDAARDARGAPAQELPATQEARG